MTLYKILAASRDELDWDITSAICSTYTLQMAIITQSEWDDNVIGEVARDPANGISPLCISGFRPQARIRVLP